MLLMSRFHSDTRYVYFSFEGGKKDTPPTLSEKGKEPFSDNPRKDLMALAEKVPSVKSLICIDTEGNKITPPLDRLKTAELLSKLDMPCKNVDVELRFKQANGKLELSILAVPQNGEEAAQSRLYSYPLDALTTPEDASIYERAINRIQFKANHSENTSA